MSVTSDKEQQLLDAITSIDKQIKDDIQDA